MHEKASFFCCARFDVVRVRLGAAMAAQANTAKAEEVLQNWYKLSLELVRHTPTYSPPVASRSLAYLGVTAFEAVASGSDELQTLAGQLNGLKPVPQREAGKTYDEAVVVQAAMAFAVKNLFENTGPTGQHAMTLLEAKMRTEVSKGVPAKVLARSETYGREVANTFWPGRRMMAARWLKPWASRRIMN